MSADKSEARPITAIETALVFVAVAGMLAGLIWLELNVPGWGVWAFLGAIVIGFVVLFARYPLAVLAALFFGIGS